MKDTETKLVRLSILTGVNERIELCTCVDEDNVIRKIIQSYEDIWQNTVNSGHISKDPIINKWAGSSTFVENLDSPGTFEYWQL